MGQDWQIIAPHQRETIGSVGKLGEGLFDGSPSRLVELLAVPIVPDDFYLDRSDRLALSDSRTNINRLLEEKQGQSKGYPAMDSRSTKRKAVDDGEQDIQNRRSQKLSKSNSNSSGTSCTVGLSELPVEMLDWIFDNLHIYDVITTGLLARRLWKIARRHIRAYYISRFGRWAGESIICVGESLGATDNPAGLLNKSEEQEIQDGYTSDDLDELGIDEIGPDECAPISLYHLAEARYKRGDKWICEFGLIGHTSLLCEDHDLPRSRMSQMRDIFRYTEEDFYPPDQPWILRNLTTKEYVRSEAIAIKPEHICGPSISCLGFGEVVLSRICWSSSDSTALEYQGKVYQGVWAGHKFDITTLSRHQKSLSDRIQWRDVSAEVAAEIAQIWEAEYGSDWRDAVSGE
ncbi:MAG: hypothetical protein M1816_004695 [Peltula sp. TS41687]|nr:MAG: hypothetical protein M1816_004695 [Peltula sp. TS41687]